jgi:hypothetical protein
MTVPTREAICSEGRDGAYDCTMMMWTIVSRPTPNSNESRAPARVHTLFACRPALAQAQHLGRVQSISSSSVSSLRPDRGRCRWRQSNEPTGLQLLSTAAGEDIHTVLCLSQSLLPIYSWVIIYSCLWTAFSWGLRYSSIS